MTFFSVIRRITGKILHVSLSMLSKILPYKGVVYMFHSIGDERHALFISQTSFVKFIKKIDKEKVVRLEEWEQHQNFVCLTFDDVAASFYYNAFPILKKYGLPFTIFVSCSLLDKDKYITTEMLKEIASYELCTVGSHGWHHSKFVEFEKTDSLKELSESKAFLENIVKKQVRLFAFPFGSFYACGFKRKRKLLNYYQYGFSTVSVPFTKPLLLREYFLPRTNVTESLIREL